MHLIRGSFYRLAFAQFDRKRYTEPSHCVRSFCSHKQTNYANKSTELHLNPNRIDRLKHFPHFSILLLMAGAFEVSVSDFQRKCGNGPLLHCRQH